MALRSSLGTSTWQAASQLCRAVLAAPHAGTCASTAALAPAGLHTASAARHSSEAAQPGAQAPVLLQPGEGIVELRSYTIAPQHMATYVSLATSFAEVRKELLPFLGMFTCDVGDSLHKLVHIYAYPSYEEREVVRRLAARDVRWQRFITESRKCLQHQASLILREAAPVYQALGLPATKQYVSPPRQNPPPGAPPAAYPRPIYELRRYQLHAGYGSVPKLADAFARGLPAKVAADPSGGKLVLFGSTEVGTLNQVVELWRFNTTGDCIRAREAARKVPAWRDAVGAVTPGVTTFTTEFLWPTSFSPWQ